MDESLLFELLSFQDGLGAGPGEAVRFFFDDLAQANGAAAVAVVQADNLAPSDEPHLNLGTGVSHGLLVGVQEVSTSKRRAPDWAGPRGDLVLIHLASLRYPEHGTDLLISLNTAFESRTGAGGGDLACSVPEEVLSSAGALFRHVLRTFEVQNWVTLGG